MLNFVLLLCLAFYTKRRRFQNPAALGRRVLGVAAFYARVFAECVLCALLLWGMEAAKGHISWM